jgi:4-alpha-glucanotransferase
MSGRRSASPAGLRALARAYGVQTAYHDIVRRRREASPETLLAILRALGAPVAEAGDAPAALRERERSFWERACDPVVVAWDGSPAEIVLRLPQARADGRVLGRLRLEGGGSREMEWDLSRSPAANGARVERERYVTKAVSLPAGIPHGYHALTVEVGSVSREALVIAAPLRAWTPPAGERGKEWGVFVPLYALRSERGLGSGDLTDLEGLLEWAGGLGGSVAGTLPLLSAFLSEPFHPSPYAPASRLFWNEFYLDPSRLPELRECPAAQALMESPSFAAALRELRASPRVDYLRGMALKRATLREMAATFFAGRAEREAPFRAFLEEDPAVEDYAAFRAAGDRHRSPWPAWPSRLRDAVVSPGDFDDRDRRYHLYVQWAFHEQFGGIADRARGRGQSVYLDLPLGVSYDSYDVWRHRRLFALESSAGAPPDDFFVQGQDWGFPPMHPERIREDGYRYYRSCVRHQLRYAGILRIDHVMGFHRFFWVPKGMGPKEGAYVRYRAEEFYAILALESHRHRARIVGEDLGTVPPYVRPAMARHGIGRMFVVQFGLKPDSAKALRPVHAGGLACVNTHDMPTFASFWDGLDIEDRVALGLLDREAEGRERARRRALKDALCAFLRAKGRLAAPAADAGEALRACLAHLAASPAATVILNLEDLYLETEPQNVPGTWTERPNWMRKMRHPFEEVREMPRALEALREVDRLRRRGRAPGPPRGRTAKAEAGKEAD